MTRYTMDLDSNIETRLNNLAKLKGTTKSEVIRRALASYSYLHEQTTSSSEGSPQGPLKVSLTDTTDRVVKDVVLP
jgi:metal-responsive CopG/Arc/MetJ family transcriptional regulator